MPKMSIKDLPHLNITKAINLLNSERDAAPIALHEASHTVAAIAHGVHITRIWVKAFYGSGRTIFTRGRDGSVMTQPNDLHQDCFISLVGLAWEDRHGDSRLALHDAQSYNFSRPWVRDEADQFVIDEYANIRLCAAAIIGLRTKKGWLERRRLAAMCQWLHPKVCPLKSYYEQGILATNDPWVVKS